MFVLQWRHLLLGWIAGFPKCLWRDRIWAKSADWRKPNAVRRSQQ
jgi:hypothetical protein